MIADGSKTIETRSYAFPEKYKDKVLAVIETAGPRGKREAGILKAQIVALIKLKCSRRYKDERDWKQDHKKHLVPVEDAQYAWGKTPERWAWEFDLIKTYTKPLPAPEKKGIVFATNCEIGSIN